MEEQVARYVASETKEPLPPPPSDVGFAGTLRRNLFNGPVDTLLTVLCGLFIVWAVWHIVEWGWINAVFVGEDRDACLGAEEVGACWAFVRAKFGQFVYGVYPMDERWRVNLMFVLFAVLALGLMIPRVPYKRLNAVLLFAVFPFVALLLLTGGQFVLPGGFVALLALGAAAATLARAATNPDTGFDTPAMRVAVWIALAGLAALMLGVIVPSGRIWIFTIGFSGLSLLSLVAAFVSIGIGMRAGLSAKSGSHRPLPYLAPIIAALALVYVLSADFGLRPVATNAWGGLLVTLVLAISGIAASLPLGMMFALGRRSTMPAVRLFCIVFIEFWRGVPLITVLFMANFMLPLFMPDGVSFDQLLRAVVGVILFSTAYQAEVIRGGLQAIPKGQYEGADAMALTYWQKMRMVILPQALKLVIPGIVNTFIGLFKDTSLVYIIGLADLLGTVKRGFSDTSWITPVTPSTGLIFAAFVYWLFCFSMSRYSIFVERRLHTGHRN